MEMGISQVPQAFQGMENLNTPAKIEAQMRLNIQGQAGDIPQERMEVYEPWSLAGLSGFAQPSVTFWMPGFTAA